jgi:glycine oxidase
LSRQFDFILVGQGLAGSLLAFLLADRGYRPLVIDSGGGSSATEVSAGIINPISGQRLVLREDFDRLSHFAQACYERLQQKFDVQLYKPLNQLRLFSSPEQASLWRNRLESPEYAALVIHGNSSSAAPVEISSPHGSCFLGRTAHVQTRTLIATVRNWLSENGWLLAEQFRHDELLPGDEEVFYHDIRARYAIFCEGAGARQNRWFADLPFKPSCGEILTIRLPFVLDKLVNWGHWLLPVSSHTCRLGATNDWDIDRRKTTGHARQQLLDSLGRVLPQSCKVEVIDHVRGLRPSTRDREPLIGHHHKHPELILFTGFGGKGALTVPAAAELLVDHLHTGKPLSAAYDLNR